MSQEPGVGLPGDVEIGRREALAALAGGAGLGAARAVDNVLLGYGLVLGTNLRSQDLAALAGERFGPSPYVAAVGDRRLVYRGGRVEVHGPGGRLAAVPARAAGRAADRDAGLGLGGALESMVADLAAVQAGDFEFAFAGYPDFFDRIDAAETRPHAVGALRGHRFRDVSPDTIREFAGVGPRTPEPLIEGLAGGFREHAGYDTPRYLAGSIEDNILFGAVDLRRYFESPTGFEAILDGSNSGLFCYDFAFRSIEAFHAAPPAEQSPPVMGAVVTDARHKHVYTGLASVVREGGDLVVPMTFLDYTHSTLYDDFSLRGVFGEGIAAYDDRHRTDDIHWNRYTIW